jgi:streptogramin lyase
MATLNAYNIGDLVRITGNLATAAGAAIDPTALVCKVMAPDGTTTTHTYGSTAFPLQAASGEYYVDVTPDAAGEWWYQFRSTGTGQAMDEGYFVVTASAI